MGQHEKRRASISGASPTDEGTSTNDQPTCLEPFSHQVGGHVSVLRWDDRTVCKPYSKREHLFYERLLASKMFTSFIPEFKGVIEVGLVEDKAGYLSLTALPSTQSNNANLEQKTPSRPSKKAKLKLKRSGSLELECFGQVEEVFQDVSASTYPQNPWAIRCQTSHIAKMRRKNKDRHQFLLLENLVYNYKCPCILDLKMGTQQHGDDATEEKRLAHTEKCQRSTSACLGTRMCGMQVYQRRSGVFKCHNKYYGRTLSVEGFKAEIRSYLHNGETFRVDLIDIFIGKLQDLLRILETADGYRFFSSSLLLIYEGADQGEREGMPPSQSPSRTCALSRHATVTVLEATLRQRTIVSHDAAKISKAFTKRHPTRSYPTITTRTEQTPTRPSQLPDCPGMEETRWYDREVSFRAGLAEYPAGGTCQHPGPILGADLHRTTHQAHSEGTLLQLTRTSLPARW